MKIVKKEPTYPRRRDSDPLAVEHALAGLLTARQLTTAERIEAVRYMAARGHTDRQIAERLRWSSLNAVTQFRHSWAIPPGVPHGRRAAA